MKCWVCKRQARGFGHSDNRHGIGDSRRYPIDWVFCSRRCQDAFHALYGNWLRAKEGRIGIKGVAMIDPSDVELAAMKKCLRSFGEAAGEIGFDKPLGVYSEAEALRVFIAKAVNSLSALSNASSSTTGAYNDGNRGDVLDSLFAGIDLISESEAGRTFSAFWRLLTDPEQAATLDQALDSVMTREFVGQLEAKERRFLLRLTRTLLEQGGMVHEVLQTFARSLKHFVQSREYLEQRRLNHLLKDAQRAALALKDEVSSRCPASATETRA